MRTKKRSLYAAQPRVNRVEGKELWRAIYESIDHGAQPQRGLHKPLVRRRRTDRANHSDDESAHCGYRSYRQRYFEGQGHVGVVMVDGAGDEEDETEERHRGEKGDDAGDQTDRRAENKSAHKTDFGRWSSTKLE